MLQEIANIEVLGWRFARKDVGNTINGQKQCIIYSGDFYGNFYRLVIYSDNTVKIEFVYALTEFICQRLEKETYEFVPIFNGSCNSLDSFIHICNEIVAPIKEVKVKGKRKNDHNLFKPKAAKQ